MEAFQLKFEDYKSSLKLFQTGQRTEDRGQRTGEEDEEFEFHQHNASILVYKIKNSEYGISCRTQNAE